MFSPAQPRAYSKLMSVKGGSRADMYRQEQPPQPSQPSQPPQPFVVSPPNTSTYASPSPTPTSPSSKMLVNMDTNVQSVLENSLGQASTEKKTADQEGHVREQKILHEQIKALEDANLDLQHQLEWCESEMKVKDDQIEFLNAESHDRSRGVKENNTNVNEQHLSTSFNAGVQKVLQKGSIFIKHTQRGAPHPRVVWVDESLRYICWRPAGTSSYDKQKSIRVQDVLDVVKGQHTKRFQRQKGRNNRSHATFSLITSDPDRTLDLEVDLGPQPADTMHHQFETDKRDEWVNALRLLIDQRPTNRQGNTYGPPMPAQ
jgi:hypothetical protein|tara:strand:- start:109 stop:1056 length:948 start_codon:yes stop_codon:yes gene_type:complete